MAERWGISEQGVATALQVKDTYRAHQPLCVPGEGESMLIPEHLLNHNLDLQGFEDPLPLAVMATRDPEVPMAMAAAARLSPIARRTKLVSGIFGIVGETSRHAEVKRLIDLVSDSAFSPHAIAEVRRQTSRAIVRTRQEYTAALKQNLKALLDGAVAPRAFVDEFFALTEAGNLRNDIRKKLVISLLLAEAIRPSIKFLFLENFDRLATPVQASVVQAVVQAKPTRHVELIREELRWIAARREGVVH